jgi:activator of 2-hydroxyglutaryl-CoA dehydratase
MSPIGQDRPSPGQAPDAIVVGVDVGSTTVKAVVLDPATRQILWSDYQRHETRQAEKTLDLSCTSTRAASCVR